MAEFPAAEFQVDGEPGTITASAHQWTNFGTAAIDAATEIRSLDSSLFIGPEGDQYREGLDRDLPPHLETTGRAYHAVGTALSSYAHMLTGLQDRMAPLRVRAPGLWDALQTAQGRVASAHEADHQHLLTVQSDDAARLPDRPAPPDTYNSDLSPATANLSSAQRAWNECLGAARRLKTELSGAIETADRAIRHAADTRFAHNPHGLSKLVSGFRGFVKDHVQGLSQLSSTLKAVSGIASVLAFVPVIGEGALIVAAVAGGTALAIDTSIKFSTGRGSWSSIAIDGAFTLVPFGIGKGVAAFRGARAAERLAATGPEPALPTLPATRAQLEAKFKHAADFGVMEPRGANGFTGFGKAVDDFVSSPSTVRISGTYRGNPAILNYDDVSRLVVVQSPDGTFVSGWQMNEAQLHSVITRGSLGGG